MRRAALLLSLLLALGLGSPVLGQDESDQPAPADNGATVELAPPQPSEEPAEVPTVAIPGRSVADLAHALSTRLGDNGALPEWGRVALPAGGRQRLSAADMFVLLARAAQAWHTDGALPTSVSLRPGATDPPILDPQDYPDPQVDLEKGREVNADALLSFVADTLRWADRFQRLPTAVWVNGARLSAAEFMAGLAVCLDYASANGELGDTVFLPDYSPPLSWAEHTDLVAASQASAQTGEEASAESTPRYGMTPPLLGLNASAPRVAKPQLALLPAPGTVSGDVDLVVSYSGPPVAFVTFMVDGKTRAIMNHAPYGYRWRTAEVSPGKHQILVRAFGDNDAEVTAQTATYVVAAPKPKQAPPTPPRNS